MADIDGRTNTIARLDATTRPEATLGRYANSKQKISWRSTSRVARRKHTIGL
jgi:hypothetical protein